jgi:hypothetical protein
MKLAMSCQAILFAVFLRPLWRAHAGWLWRHSFLPYWKNQHIDNAGDVPIQGNGPMLQDTLQTAGLRTADQLPAVKSNLVIRRVLKTNRIFV